MSAKMSEVSKLSWLTESNQELDVEQNLGSKMVKNGKHFLTQAQQLDIVQFSEIFLTLFS